MVERVAAIVFDRIRSECLYELQTGGGLGLGRPRDETGRPTSSAEIDALVVRIHHSVNELQSFFRIAPREVAAQIGGRSQALKVLDFGAGAAPWSLAFAALSPKVRVTAVDLPAQLPSLSEAVEAAGYGGQFDLVAANVFTQDFAPLGAFDVAIVANVCHLFESHRNEELLGIVARSLAPGGTLAIIDQVLEVEPDWGRWSALYAVGALHGAPGGRLYPPTTYARWLLKAGCGNVNTSLVSPLPPLTLITARVAPCP